MRSAAAALPQRRFVIVVVLIQPRRRRAPPVNRRFLQRILLLHNFGETRRLGNVRNGSRRIAPRQEMQRPQQAAVGSAAVVAVDAAAPPELPERFGGRFLLLLFFLVVVVDGGGEELNQPLLLRVFVVSVGIGTARIDLFRRSGFLDLDGEDSAIGEELVGGGDLQVMSDAEIEIEIDRGIQMQMIVRFDRHEVQLLEIVREGDSGADDWAGDL